jgi:hypothetical protein
MALGPAYGDGFVGQSNPARPGQEGPFVYVKGDANTDGSLRLRPDSLNEELVEMQLRTSGVWNDTGIQVAASTVHLGRDLRISAAGDFILISDVDDEEQSLIPHVEFTETEGTTEPPHSPVLTPLQEAFVLQPIFSVDTLTDKHVSQATSPARILVKDFHVRIGATAPTEPVQMRIYNGFDESGILFFEWTYPASDFTANTEIELDTHGLVGVDDGTPVFEVLESAAPFSLLGAGPEEPWRAISFHIVSEEQLMTSTTGMDRVLVDQNAHIVSDISGNLILAGAGSE